MHRMHVLSQILWFALGISLIILVFDSVIRTFVLPRASSPLVTRVVFIVLRSGFNLIARTARTYNGRDSVMSLFGPIGLLLLPAVWSVMILAAYTMMFHALGVSGFERVVAVHPRVRAAARSRHQHPGVPRGGDRSHRPRPLDRVSADDLLGVLPPRGAGRAARGARRQPAVGRAPAGAVAAHGALPPARRLLGHLAAVVHRAGGDPHP